MADTYTLPEHLRIADDLLVESDRLFAEGKELLGSEALWGAAAHALVAVALDRELPHDSHGALKKAARSLSAVPAQPQWLSEFNMAEQFHRHFYHGILTDRQIAADRPKVRRFVARLQSVVQ